ncbi:MAG TPA: hypothetical protein PK971_12700 [Saprospiraceae bacterium]|nr:hypothetical protein [Saprospiraceae bacterium]HND89185.1 hypothetical protein [Saprospiraceae bacterium]
MRLIHSLPAFGLLLCGAILPTRSLPLPQPVKSAPPPFAPKMWIEKPTLYQGETLQLHFRTPNAPYLGVVDPKGKFYYVVFPTDQAVGKLQPLVSSQQFRNLSVLSISLADFKADPYTHGVYENQPVFTQSGTYTFILGENLHTDQSSTLHKVSVQYHHQPRPRSGNADVAAN